MSAEQVTLETPVVPQEAPNPDTTLQQEIQNSDTTSQQKTQNPDSAPQQETQNSESTPQQETPAPQEPKIVLDVVDVLDVKVEGRSKLVILCSGKECYVEACQGKELSPELNKIGCLDEVFQYKLATSIVESENRIGIDAKRAVIVDVSDFPKVHVAVDYSFENPSIYGIQNLEESFQNPDYQGKTVLMIFINKHAGTACVKASSSAVASRFSAYEL